MSQIFLCYPLPWRDEIYRQRVDVRDGWLVYKILNSVGPKTIMMTYETSPIFRSFARAFVTLEKTTRFPAVVALAITAVESGGVSGWFSNPITPFNFWGVTRPPEDGPALMALTHEDITEAQLAGFRPDERATAVKVKDLGGGRFRYSMRRWFADYPTLEAGCLAFIEFFTASPKRYTPAWEQYLLDRNTDAFLMNIGKAGYATGPASQVELTIAHQQNLQHAVAQAREELA